MILVTCSLALSYLVFKKTNILFSAAYFYFSIIAIAKISAAQYFWPGLDLSDVVGLESIVAESYLYLTSFVILFCIIDIKNLERVFLIFGLIDSLIILGKWVMGYGPYFLLNNPAIDAAYISALIPFSIKFGAPWIFILACLVTKSSTSIMGLGVGIGSYWLAKNKFSVKSLIISLGIAFLCALLGLFMQGNVLLDSSGRYTIWEWAMKYWSIHSNYWIGMGSGTFQMFGPSIQIDHYLSLGVKEDMLIAGFIWLHNDWLQVLFETGIIGLLFVGAIFICAVFNLRRKPAEFASLLAFGAIAILQMPLRWPILCLLGMFLIVSSTKK